jgi:hypothetical protein
MPTAFSRHSKAAAEVVCSVSTGSSRGPEGKALAGYAVASSPHPDQGLTTALQMEVTAVVTTLCSGRALSSA